MACVDVQGVENLAKDQERARKPSLVRLRRGIVGERLPNQPRGTFLVERRRRYLCVILTDEIKPIFMPFEKSSVPFRVGPDFTPTFPTKQNVRIARYAPSNPHRMFV